MFISTFFARQVINVFLVIVFSLVMALASPIEEGKEVKEDYRIRFFSPIRNPLLHYRVDSNGRVSVLESEFGDNPPNAFYLGKDELRIRVSLLDGALGNWIQIPHKKTPGGVLNLIAEKATYQRAKAIGPAADNKGGEGSGAASGAPTITDVPLLNLRIPSTEPALVCFYQSSHKAKWITPKELLVSLNDNTAPVGSCLTINLTESPIFVALGDAAKPLQVKPGSFATITSVGKDSNGRVPLKIALGSSVVCRKPQRFPSGERTLLVVIPVDPAENAGSPAKFQVFDLDMPKPPKEKAKVKTTKD